MKFRQFYQTDIIDNERGMILVVSLVMLLLLTIIGTAAVDTSRMEMMISSIEKDKQGAFFAAEAGIEHGKALLGNLFVTRNAAALQAGGTPDWDFALNGSQAGVNAATDTDYDGGTVWISDADGGFGHTYSVRVWNNSDTGGGTTNDTDGLLYLRSDARGPGGAAVSIEVLLQGLVTGSGGYSGYAAQAGGGSAKAYSNDDQNKITSYNTQL